jgi:hypothetical protein
MSESLLSRMAMGLIKTAPASIAAAVTPLLSPRDQLAKADADMAAAVARRPALEDERNTWDDAANAGDSAAPAKAKAADDALAALDREIDRLGRVRARAKSRVNAERLAQLAQLKAERIDRVRGDADDFRNAAGAVDKAMVGLVEALNDLREKRNHLQVRVASDEAATMLEGFAMKIAPLVSNAIGATGFHAKPVPLAERTVSDALPDLGRLVSLFIPSDSLQD